MTPTDSDGLTTEREARDEQRDAPTAVPSTDVPWESDPARADIQPPVVNAPSAADEKRYRRVQALKLAIDARSGDETPEITTERATAYTKWIESDE